MRLPVFKEPRVIQCAELFDDYIGLPRGCEEKLVKLFEHYHIQLSIIDKREIGQEINVAFSGTLSLSQQEAVSMMLKHDIGVLSAITGFGKTVVAAKMISERKTSTLILVHRQQLLDQWLERLTVFLGLDKTKIGLIKGGKFKPSDQIDIAMLQSVVKEGVVTKEINEYGHVIVDECHHLSSFSFEKVLKHLKAKYILGLTATPFRKDGRHPIIFMQCGPVRFQTTKKMQVDSGQHLKVYSKHVTLQQSQEVETIASLYNTLAGDLMRNQLVLHDIIKAFHEGRYPLLLTNRTQHLDWFLEKLQRADIKDVYVLKGGMRKKTKDDIMAQIANNEKNRILLATGSYIGEGFDDPRLDTLFLALPISWHGTLQQYLGRLHRQHEQKHVIEVYDYVDVHSAVCMRMYQKRVKKYKAMGLVFMKIRIKYGF